MSQELKSSSEHQTRSSTTYRCFDCSHDIEDHVYFVQRRRIRKIPKNAPSSLSERVRLGIQFDAVDPSHAGVILGPEFDPHCSSCYKELLTIQELIDAHKNRLDKERKDLD